MARRISVNNLACWTTEELWWILGFVRSRVEWFILIVIYKIEVLHTQQKLDLLLLQALPNLSSLSSGSVAELWLLLCYTAGEKTQLPVFSAHLSFSLGLVCKKKSTSKDKSWISLLFQMLLLILPLHFLQLYKCNWGSKAGCPFLRAVKAFCSEE